MKYKPDWDTVLENWTSLWNGNQIGRPCLTVTARNHRHAAEIPQPESIEDRYCDPDYFVRNTLRSFDLTYWGAEAYPSTLTLCDWTTTCQNVKPTFLPETIWFEPIDIDIDEPPTLPFSLDTPRVRQCEDLRKALVQAAEKDNFLVGQICAMPPADALAMIIGTEAFMTSIAINPEWIHSTLADLRVLFAALVKRFAAIARDSTDYWYGCPGWAPFWAPEPFVATQCDLSCMISPDMFQEFIMPELDMIAQELGPIWYHLDGEGALKHLDTLLSLEYIRVIQWVPDAHRPPNGPEWINLYKQIQKAGKIVQINIAPENIMSVVKALDPSLLCINTHCKTPEEANELLASVKRWSTSHQINS